MGEYRRLPEIDLKLYEFALSMSDQDPGCVKTHRLEISAPVVFKWRKRYQETGPDGLNDRPRRGHPRKLDEAKIKKMLTLTTSRVPREATHWSLRLMANYVGVSAGQVAQVWAAGDLKPHRLKTFKISNDPHVAGKVADVVGRYLNPPDNARVQSVDEKTQIQALNRTHVNSRANFSRFPG